MPLSYTKRDPEHAERASSGDESAPNGGWTFVAGAAVAA
jgi:hypothetical protein